jgi:hypothetical protein
MKRVLYIIKIITVNIVLIDIFFITFNPFQKSLDFMIKHGIEWLFSPNPEMNILMFCSLIGMVLFNWEWISKINILKSSNEA